MKVHLRRPCQTVCSHTQLIAQGRICQIHRLRKLKKFNSVQLTLCKIINCLTMRIVGVIDGQTLQAMWQQRSSKSVGRRVFSLKTEASADGGFFNLVPCIVRGVPVSRPFVVECSTTFLRRGQSTAWLSSRSHCERSEIPHLGHS